MRRGGWRFGYPPRVYVQRVSLENVRSFRRLDLDLTRPDGGLAGWTVIAARNGSGKTTLLHAIALGLTGGESVFAFDDNGAGWVGSDGDTSTQTYTWLRGEDDRIPRGSDWYNVRDPIGEMDADRFDEAARWLEHAYPDKQVGFQLRIGAKKEEWSFIGGGLEYTLRECLERETGWFAAGYGAFRRRFGHASELSERIRKSRKAAAFATLFREDQALVECTDWLKNTHLRALDKQDLALHALRDDALRLLNDGLLPDGVTLTRVDSDGLWARRRSGAEAPFDHLSSGFRVVSSLVLDVIAQMYRAFGRLQVDVHDGHLSVPHSGVVLIDEAEEHLHPSWQRNLGAWLKAHFPNMQFIVTTHSSFVCQEADLLIRLHPDGDDAWTASPASPATHAAVTNGTLDDAVMSDLFGVEEIYTPRTTALRDELAGLEVKVMRGAASEEETRRFHELAAKVPAGGTAAVEQSIRTLAKLG